MKVYQKALLVFALLIGTALILNEINGIKVTKITDPFGPRIIPAVLCIYIFISSSLLIVCSKDIAKKIQMDHKSTISSMMYFLFVFAYVLFMRYLGFVLSSIIYTECSVIFFGGKNIPKRKVVYSSMIIIVFVVYFVFEFLNMNLPKGLIMNGSI